MLLALDGSEVGLRLQLLPLLSTAVCTGYVSRSVAGSFDNEAVAIFALITTFYLFVRAVRLGTVASAAMAAFAYLYMAASWGAYVFISNLIPLYVLMMIAIRRYHR
jgi:dolichyl-diphosphooligosaccharide--protein glycosyltransferase